MSQNSSPITHAASILAARRRTAGQGPRLPEPCRPVDTETALAIQAEVTEQLGATVRAWKCATPAEGRIIAAPIYDVAAQGDGPCPAIIRAGSCRVEPELAFVLGKDLPARSEAYTAAEIDAAISETRLALELIDSRYRDHGSVPFEEHLADGLLNQGLYLGMPVDGDKARAAAALPIHVTLETGEETLLDGRHPNGEPRAPLYWLAEFLRGRGIGLRAGQAVITGSYVPSFELPAGVGATIRYGDLGALTVRFSPR